MKKQTITAEQRKQEKQWRVESDMNALKRAAEIKSDPTRMKEVQKAAAQIQSACSSGRTPPKKKK